MTSLPIPSPGMRPGEEQLVSASAETGVLGEELPILRVLATAEAIVGGRWEEGGGGGGGSGGEEWE